MWLTINTDDLTFATSTVSRIISSKSSGTSSGIRITAEDNKLNFMANDLEIGISCTIPAEVRESGSLVVPGRLFSEAVRRLPAQETDLRIPEGRQMLLITSGSASLDLVGLSSIHFPELPDIDDYSHMAVPQKLLKSMLRQVGFAISSDNMRPILTGMLWEHSDAQLRMIAADGFTVASRKETIGQQADQGFKVVVPGKTVSELVRLLEDSEDLAEIAVGTNHVLVRAGSTTVISRLLEGKYLNVDQYLPSTFVTEITCKPRTLLDALERASVVSKEGVGGTVRLLITKDQVTVSAQSAEYGSHLEEWPIETTGEDLDILFNIRVLSEVLKSIEHGDVSIKFTGNLGPCISVCPGNDNYWSLAMPVRLS